jgi:ATP-dependent DNA helicase RecQ
VEVLIESLDERFQQREKNDIARTREVLAYASHPGCLTRRLLGYFGEEREDCGHCDRCKAVPRDPMPAMASPTLGDDDARRIQGVMAERHEALASPRQLARFLCGINSPRTSRGKLNKHALFGACEKVPFSVVIKMVAELAAPDGRD